jgi:surfactin synthase thioesterase subunit
MKVIFSHGKESGPWGFKIKRLAAIAEERDCSVDSIDYTDLMDPNQRVIRLLDILKQETEPFALVGSSMGGYVSLVASESVATKGVFLMAPALYNPSFKKQQYESKSPLIDIVHGWSDDIISVDHSIKFARQANCALHLICGDHPLNDVFEEVEALFVRFLSRVKGDS